jgi:hypothetical protein
MQYHHTFSKCEKTAFRNAGIPFTTPLQHEWENTLNIQPFHLNGKMLLLSGHLNRIML